MNAGRVWNRYAVVYSNVLDCPKFLLKPQNKYPAEIDLMMFGIHGGQVHYHFTFLLCQYASLNDVRKIKVQRRPWGTVMCIHQFTRVCSDRYRVSHAVTTRELLQRASIPGHMSWSQPMKSDKQPVWCVFALFGNTGWPDECWIMVAFSVYFQTVFAI